MDLPPGVDTEKPGLVPGFFFGVMDRLSGNQPGEPLGDISGQIQAVVVILHHGLGIGVAGEGLHGADIAVGQVQGGCYGGMAQSVRLDAAPDGLFRNPSDD